VQQQVMNINRVAMPMKAGDSAVAANWRAKGLYVDQDGSKPAFVWSKPLPATGMRQSSSKVSETGSPLMKRNCIKMFEAPTPTINLAFVERFL
jgi:hypothetical protein